MPVRVVSGTVLRFGVFEFDLDAQELRKAGTRLKLQKQPCQALKVLLQRSGGLVTREELCSEMWPDDTFVDFDNSLNTAINKLRDALGDTSSNPRFIETVPRRGYRFIAPVTENGHQTIPPVVASERPRARWKIVAAASVVFVVVASVVWYLPRRHVPAEKNSVLLADFVNRAGDSVFDGILRQGLSFQLEQSPFLRLISDEQIHDTLRMMGRATNGELSLEVAREICQRNNAAVALDGSIVLIGTRYELVLRAVDCASGDLIASAEARAQDKNHVLDAVSQLASDMRGRLGESLSSVRRYNIPLASATTSSLEALRFYTQGIQVLAQQFGYKEALSWFQKAIELDRNFAMAYWAVGDVYAILGETESAVEYTQKAFELRERVSEREKGLIEAHYYYYVLGDIEKARRSCELLRQQYPYSEDAHNSVAAFAESIGQYDLGLTEYLEALRLAPRRSFLYRDVAYTYLVLDRIEEASAVVRRARQMDLGENLAPVLYSIAFYRDDGSEMERQVAGAAGKPEIEDLLVALDGDTSAYSGHLERARALTRRAAELADAAGKRETETLYYASSAVREALFGNSNEAQSQATAVGKYPRSRDVAYGLALAFLYASDLDRGQALTEQLAKTFPEDTVVKCNYLPTLRGKLAILRSSPEQAINILGLTGTCELGLPVYSYYNWPNLYPAYVRGEAYLAAHRSDEAAAEFEKILTHRGIILNEPIGALAHLQLGRAYVMGGHVEKGRAAYRKFLVLWKDADPDIPVLKQAKAEYAKLSEVALLHSGGE
ncbi:MAG: hypothetical protein JWQ87_1393 [Candidatus Sulfotelmatobacter sp.]|nr:hypothetical protein [Candidatus Sulfotelmatobacter sp.]